jgi:DDE superfamily endonuclease
MDILTLFSCFQPLATSVTVGHFAIIAEAILTMSGRITMLGISRWTPKGGSYRTVQRFFNTDLPWTELLVKFFSTHLFDGTGEYIVAGDATTVTKSGKKTNGIDSYFSGVIGKVVRGLEFFVFSLVNVQKRKSYPLAVGQMVRTTEEKAAIKKRKKERLQKKKRRQKGGKSAKRGRKKGSKNKDKNKLEMSSELGRISDLLGVFIKLIRTFVAVRYVAMDGYFGHNQAVLMARLHGLELISKMQYNAALIKKYEGEQKKYGARRKYGERLDYDNLPTKYLKKSERKKGVITNYFSGIFLHEKFGCELNVVIIQKYNVKTKKLGQVILFSSDVELGWEKLVDYYSLRFQIEFNFRDAKQHFGLEDFMNVTKKGVENAANLSFMMVNLSEKLLADKEQKCVGINDLKSHYRGVKYAVETIKRVMKKPEAILINQIKEEIGRLGSIHQPKSKLSHA